MRRRSIAVASLILFISAGFATSEFLDHSPATPPPENYIVQAHSLEQARAAVALVGGEVTHELGIINAVATRLDKAQRARLQSMAGIRRIYRDRAVETATVCDLTAAAELEFDDEEVSWTIVNSGNAEIKLSKATVIWPSSNDELERMKFGDTGVYDGSIDGISAAFSMAQTALTDSSLAINPGQNKKLRVEFDDDARQQQKSYEILAVFDNGCSVTFPRPEDVHFAGDSDKEAKRTYVSSLTGADALHWQGITGAGVGVAVVDTGIWANPAKGRYLTHNSHDEVRIVAHYDAIADQELSPTAHSDDNGHGSHITSLLASSRYKHSEFNGIAPDVNLIIAKAFDDDGIGTYADVIRAMDWVVKHKDTHGVRVLNLSFSADPKSYYWDDPLNQAVMAAWGAGIVVVAAAGNGGPDAMTIGVPGNLPYVITAGAMTDSVTPMDWTDDKLASFSAAGPTVEAFVKPDLVAPGGHLRGMMGKENTIATNHPHFHDGDAYYTMSGTSQSAAIVSGVVALLLEAQPWLTPDQVKCKLMSSARAATDAQGTPAYSVFQQGAGMVDAQAALATSASACANVGLDIQDDLSGAAHFQGRAEQSAAGDYSVGGSEGHTWDGSFGVSEGYVWAGGMLWNDGILWSRGMLWNDGVLWNVGMLWNDGINTSNSELSSDGMLWNDGKPASVDVNIWVEQE